MHRLIEQAFSALTDRFKQVDDVALFCQNKVLRGFIDNRVALRHFAPTTGYGYDDVARDTLNKLYANVFGTEDAIVSPLIASGTHALSLGLFGLLRPGDKLLCATGKPYDTLNDVIFAEGIGSLKDFGIECRIVPLKDGLPDMEAIQAAISNTSPRVVMIQRSRGYDVRPALSVAIMKDIANFAHAAGAAVFIDNCYGEFTEKEEPSFADAFAGSLIKNPGGGIAPTGGYICGTKEAVSAIEGRLTAPSVGREVGSYSGDYRLFYQGLFLAPHVTAQSIKTALLFSHVFSELGYRTMPRPTDNIDDIICSIGFGDRDKLISFCKSIQSVSPVDSFALPEPWAMPGYADEVIMAAGAFVQGASIELSCDAPMRPPYTAYLQGGLTLEHGIIALESCLAALGVE